MSWIFLLLQIVMIIVFVVVISMIIYFLILAIKALRIYIDNAKHT